MVAAVFEVGGTFKARRNRTASFFEQDVSPEFCKTRWSWAAALFSFQSSDWLQDQRVIYYRSRGQEGVYSRTGTRAVRGVVHARFHEGVDYARRMLQ